MLILGQILCIPFCQFGDIFIQFIEYFLVCYLFYHHQSPKVEAIVEQVNAWFKQVWIFLYVFSGEVRSTEGPVSISKQGVW